MPGARSLHMPSCFDDATRYIGTYAKTFALPPFESPPRQWSAAGVIARRPDVACVANTELAVAWFERLDDGGYKVVLETGTPSGAGPSPQRFSLGSGSPSRGLSVAATSDRVYVAWFQGSTLKVRRFRIGTSSAHTLTSLGTTTIGTFQGGTTPKIGADGSKVVLAYTHGADLKVRRSTNRGVSFGSATTIRNLPDASEVGATRHHRVGQGGPRGARHHRCRAASTRIYGRRPRLQEHQRRRIVHEAQPPTRAVASSPPW